MNQQIQEELIKMWLNRPQDLKEAQKVSLEGEQLGRFMVIPMLDTCYISILIGDVVQESSIEPVEGIDFVRGDIKRGKGKDIFIEETICRISKYDLKFGLYEDAEVINKPQEAIGKPSKAITNVLVEIIKEQYHNPVSV